MKDLGCHAEVQLPAHADSEVSSPVRPKERGGSGSSQPAKRCIVAKAIASKDQSVHVARHASVCCT